MKASFFHLVEVYTFTARTSGGFKVSALRDLGLEGLRAEHVVNST